MLPDFKKCNVCNEEKFITNFPKDDKSKDGYKNICKKCVGAKSKARYEKRKQNNETPLQKLINLQLENNKLHEELFILKSKIEAEPTTQTTISDYEEKINTLKRSLIEQKHLNIEQAKTLEKWQLSYHDLKERFAERENKYYKLKSRINLLYVATARLKSRFGRIVIKKQTLLNRLLDE